MSQSLEFGVRTPNGSEARRLAYKKEHALVFDGK